MSQARRDGQEGKERITWEQRREEGLTGQICPRIPQYTPLIGPVGAVGRPGALACYKLSVRRDKGTRAQFTIMQYHVNIVWSLSVCVCVILCLILTS